MHFDRYIEDGLTFALTAAAVPLSTEDKWEQIKGPLEDICKIDKRAAIEILEIILGIDDQALGKVVRETAIHSVSTSIYASLLVAEDNLDKKQRMAISQAALFHDIGKIKVDKTILFKPGKLSKDEFGIVKQHAAWGAVHLMAFNDVRPEIPVAALYHHWTTRNYGYDEQINSHLPAYIRDFAKNDDSMRHVVDIVSIADSVSAVVDSRTYSEGSISRLPHILAELRDMCDGTKYRRRCRGNIDKLAKRLGITMGGKCIVER